MMDGVGMMAAFGINLKDRPPGIQNQFQKVLCNSTSSKVLSRTEMFFVSVKLSFVSPGILVLDSSDLID